MKAKKPTPRMLAEWDKYVDPRREKKYFRQSETYLAYLLGGEACRTGAPNPYPPGVRHDQFERGKKTADPMGDYHGRNW